ncbi:MAG: seryl-tRNA synthetase [Clostridiales bacterium]|jgi:seryl-tRNA synthetase|nr:seryl-tRNA synthetase [Clostridiales bacterium]
MLDINLIRSNPDMVREKLARKGYEVDFAEFLELDANRRQLIGETERLKAEKNKTSAEIPKLKKEGLDTTEVMARMKQVSDQTRKIDEQLAELNARQQSFLEALPNLPADDVVAGGKENNEVIKVVGTKPEFAFAARHHVDIVEKLGIIDYTRGAKLGGSGFWVYRKDGALLEWALLNYFMSCHLRDGYEMMFPPHILTYQCGYTAGQFPKFKDDVFQLRRDDGEDFTHFILPTAETALVNLHRDEILNEEELPLKYFAYTPCYRKEAGSYRAEERGMIRGHQFNKIEMFQYTTPEQSDDALEELVAKAAELVEGLGLHFRISKLAAGDCSASMTKTYDIEVWIPSMDDYKEVSSASNAGDYQSRRGNMKFRRQSTGKTELMHTLNASGLATSRILPALVEHYQQADGSVIIPEVLRPWMGGREKIEVK